MILVVATARSGSTALCAELEERTGYNNLGELLAVEEYPDNVEFETQRRFEYIDRYREKISQDPRPWIVKVFPEQIVANPKYSFSMRAKIELAWSTIKDSADQIIFLERRDFLAQCRSAYIGDYLYNNSKGEIGFLDQWQHHKTVIVDPVRWRQIVNHVRREKTLWHTLKLRFSRDPRFRMQYTEDLPKGRLNRPVQWQPYAPELRDQDRDTGIDHS